MEKAKITGNGAQRNELHRTIWGLANDLRGSVDGWDFKQYVLGFLFYRYISENITEYINREEHASGDTEFNYEDLSDEDAESIRQEMIETKGYFILPSQLFVNVKKSAKQDKDLNITIQKIFEEIENSSSGTMNEENFRGLFADIDVNSDKLGDTVIKRNDKLNKILNGISDLRLGNYSDNQIDAFGDAYEYLMGMYASSAGKSGGEYFTPVSISRLLAMLGLSGKDTINKVYDPACGSGSLLLQIPKLIGERNIVQGYYGQDINPTTSRLCRLNFILHNVEYNKYNIACGDTLTEPAPYHYDEEPFDIILSNPPYSIKWAGKSDPILINDERYSPAGILAPESKADMAFIMHSLAWLSPTGTAAIVCFPGIFYRGGAEQKIREYLIENNFVDAVIQLPANMFYGTSISTNILVMRKNKSDSDVMFIDASEEFIKDGNKNVLSEENIETIYNFYKEHKNEDHKVALIPKEKIAENNYNLSVSSYVEAKSVKEVIDIDELNTEIEKCVERSDELRAKINEIISGVEV